MRVAAALTAALSTSSLWLALPAHADAPEATATADEQTAAHDEEPPPQAPTEKAPTDEDAASDARTVAMRAHNSLMGSVGGLHVIDAGSGPKGSFRLSVTGYFMKKKDFLLLGDDNALGGGTLALSVTPEEWLELSLATSVRSFDNSGNVASPGLLQTIGDLHAGVKGFHEVRPGLTVGGDVRVDFLSGYRGLGKDLSSTSAMLRFNSSFDLRELSPRPLPMILRMNLGYYFDNSAKAVRGVEQSRLDALQAQRGPVNPEYQHLVTRAERFGLQINRSDMLTLALGGEWPLEMKRAVVTPLLEWVWGIPVNRQGFTCPYPRGSNGNKLPGVDSCLSEEGLAVWPSTLTIGTSVQPKALEGLTLMTAVDVGLSGTSTFVQELAPNAPYTVYFGLAYAVDMKPKVVVEKVEVPVEVPAEPPATARVLGQVVDASGGGGIARAVVHFEGMDVSDLATDSEGHFTSYPLPPGTHVALSISAEDYESSTCEATLPEEAPEEAADVAEAPEKAADVEATCSLVAVPRVGDVSGRIIDGEGVPLAGERVVLRGRDTHEVTTGATGEFAVSGLSVGNYTATVEDAEHLVKVEPFEVIKGHTAKLELTLRSKPKAPVVRMLRGAIRLRKPITFSEGTAKLEPRSEPVLEELADLLIRNPDVALVEVQGHVDPSTDGARDQRLSEDRARTVREWLVGHGVAAERVADRGFGSTQPLRPNVTPRNRELNRRIEVVIPEATDEAAAE